jgi:hypothetical protein
VFSKQKSYTKRSYFLGEKSIRILFTASARSGEAASVLMPLMDETFAPPKDKDLVAHPS